MEAKYTIDLNSVLGCQMEDFDDNVVCDDFVQAKEYAIDAFEMVIERRDKSVRTDPGRGHFRGSRPWVVGAPLRVDRRRAPTRRGELSVAGTVIPTSLG